MREAEQRDDREATGWPARVELKLYSWNFLRSTNLIDVSSSRRPRERDSFHDAKCS